MDGVWEQLWDISCPSWNGARRGRRTDQSQACNPLLSRGFPDRITLAYFAFSAPAVIARWTEADYRLIVMAVSLLSLGWVGISLGKLRLIEAITPTGLLIWNLLFTFALVLTILAQRVPFPQTPDSAAVVVGQPGWLQQLPLVLTLLLFPGHLS